MRTDLPLNEIGRTSNTAYGWPTLHGFGETGITVRNRDSMNSGREGVG